MDLNLLNVIKISHLISFHTSFLLYIYIYIIISRETNKLIILVYTSISKFQFFSPILLFLNHSTYKLFYRERERERDGLFLLKRKKKKEELCKMRWQDLVEEGRIETLVGKISRKEAVLVVVSLLKKAGRNSPNGPSSHGRYGLYFFVWCTLRPRNWNDQSNTWEKEGGGY